MCGIFFCIFKDCHNSKVKALLDTVIPIVSRRGPDCIKTEQKRISNGQLCLHLTGSVLHLRGELTPQPLQDKAGNTLLWNGEVFDGIEILDDINDTTKLLNLLEKIEDDESILYLLSSIRGPWAFMYYQVEQEKLWFGRDFFGRRSLVWTFPADNDGLFAVSSVGKRDDVEWKEVPADGIYCLEFKPKYSSSENAVEFLQFDSVLLKKYPWTLNKKIPKGMLCLKQPVLPFNKQLPLGEELENLDLHYDDLGLSKKDGFNSLSSVSSLKKSVNYRKLNESGSCLSIKTEKNDDNISNENKPCYKKELDNFSKSQTVVTLDNEQKATNTQSEFEVLSSQCSVELLSTLCQKTLATSTSYDLHQEGLSNKAKTESKYIKYIQTLPNDFIKILGEAVRKRVFNLPRGDLSDSSLGEMLPTCSGNFKKAKVGVLFSGGIDSIVLAALADRFVPSNESIDLLNVAFEQKPPRNNPTNKKKTIPCENKDKMLTFNVPDRLTGLSGLKELALINPQRQWNFIEINVTLHDLQKERCDHITHLVSPLSSVLDDSIGCALWFAARGSGTLRCPSCVDSIGPQCKHPRSITSQAKVLLVGMGADEQLGGYARHRTKFNQEGWQGLADEMEMEVKRISQRNLGRDDRCISDHGREARFPFLDEEVVSFLNGIPVWLKADPRLPRGTGEKILLRKAAQLLGLTSSAVLPKRAIQFGSRIAKLEGTQEKGSDTCGRLKS